VMFKILGKAEAAATPEPAKPPAATT
jgi:hypothetical protein